MAIKWFKSKPATRISRGQALRCRPIKNPLVIETRLETGELQLAWPVELKPWMQTLLDRIQKNHTPPQRKLQLDHLGSGVWRMIDNQRDVHEIIARFADAHQLDAQEAEPAVTKFLYDLGKRGLLGFK